MQKKITLDSVSSTDIQNSGFKLIYEIWKTQPGLFNQKKALTEEEFIHNFFRGYFNRPSVRISKPSQTVSDALIEEIIQMILPQSNAQEVTYSHRAVMAVENVIGSIVEEYIHIKVLEYGWICCWGEIIPAADFINAENCHLLQVKNKDNTENSSSSKIRNGTEIQKWFRLEAKTGKTHWQTLNETVGQQDLMSEEDFRIFAQKLIKNNPNLICLTFK